MRLVFLGPPGAGKGTQAKRLSEAQELLHLSTGDILRGAIQGGTKTGLEAKAYMDRGELVPDSVVDRIVADRLGEDDAARFLLDGYPRNLAQAKALARLLAERGTPLTAVVYLDVPDDVLLARIEARGEGRADDRAEVVRERLRVYREHTQPLVQHYGAQGTLKRIDGTRTIAEVANDVLAVLGAGEAA